MNYNIIAKAFIYQGELDYISRCVLDYPNIETGGDIFGFWTHTGSPVIQYVIGPGKNANHQVAFFNQELEYLDNYGKILRSGHALQHIGQWHSHHQLGLAEPSQHDISTVCNAINQYRLNQFFLVIANIRQQTSSINGFLFRLNQNRCFDYAIWEVMEGESPIRKIVDTQYPDLISLPKTATASIDFLAKVNRQTSPTLGINYNTGNWLEDKKNHAVLKQIIDYLSLSFGSIKVYIDNTNNTVFIELKDFQGIFRIYFVDDYPEGKPFVKFLHKGIFKKVNDNLVYWQSDLDVAERTVKFIKNIVEMKVTKKQLINIVPIK